MSEIKRLGETTRAAGGEAVFKLGATYFNISLYSEDSLQFMHWMHWLSSLPIEELRKACLGNKALEDFVYEYDRLCNKYSK